MENTNIILSGERFQKMAHFFIGTPPLFYSNPSIYTTALIRKCIDIHAINQPFDNPPILFCYPDIIPLFAEKCCFFQNPFVLITHNSDIVIAESPHINYILKHTLLIHWFAVNVCMSHPKLSPLPIGIANEQWPHGNLSTFRFQPDSLKTKEIYMNFTISTASQKRVICKTVLENKGVPFLETVDSAENMRRLSQYKYCICPEGNGPDTHRVWECLYMKTVPISLKTAFSVNIKRRFDIPILLLDYWEELDVANLPAYESFDFDTSWKWLDIGTYENWIREAATGI